MIAILLGPTFIRFLRRHEFGQQIREEGPQHHLAKQGTPTMGGLLILLGAAIGFLALTTYTVPGLAVLFVTLGCGAIGFTDDLIKLTHKRSLGLSGRWKLVLLGLITIGVGIAARHQHLPTEVYVPARRRDPALVGLVRAALPGDRGRRERSQPRPTASTGSRRGRASSRCSRSRRWP